MEAASPRKHAPPRRPAPLPCVPRPRRPARPPHAPQDRPGRPRGALLPRCRRGDRQEPGPQLCLPPADRLRQDRRLALLRHRLLPLRPLLEAAAQALLHGAAQHQPHLVLRLHQEGGDPPADERHLDEFRDDHQDERELSALTNKIVSRAAFGRRKAHPEPILGTIREALDLVLGFYFADVFPSLSFLDYLTGANFKLRRLHSQFDAVLSAIIEEHEANGRDSNEVEHMVDVVLRVKDDAELEIPMTMDNVRAVILDLLVGGTETSSEVLVWAMSELKCVIKETLRLHPPYPLLPRSCKQTCDVLGYEIRAGTKVCIDAWAIGRDPRHWDAADSFRQQRFEEGSVDFKGSDFQYLPFGGGRRMCPGAAFALATMELTLAQLLLYFDWEIPEGMKPEELDMSKGFGLVAARKTELKPLATPRVPLPSAV